MIADRDSLVKIIFSNLASTALPASMDRVERDDYGSDSYRRERHVVSLTKESKSWRISSGFALASLLNRNSSNNAPLSGMPKFSLPSLHSFGKSSLAKVDTPLRSQLYEDDNHFVSSRHSHQQRRNVSSSVQALSRSPNSRRIAPAPADEIDPEREAEAESAVAAACGGHANQSIRGGRWTADEHERFLEGFRVHGHKWKRVQQVVRTRSVTQVRTHAQKYLLKLAKLKAEKKQCGKSVDMVTRSAEQQTRSMTRNSDFVPVTPELSTSDDSLYKTPCKKVRRLDPGNCDPVDQKYIAAAATTLCLLMSQKIDSLLDTRHDARTEGHKSDFEPYDCYSSQPVKKVESAQPSESRKRSYMHIITDEQDYSPAYDSEPSAFTIEGSKLCS